MTEPTPSLPPEVVAGSVGFWEAQERTINALAHEIDDPYIPKDRLRRIAVMALAQLWAMTEAAKLEEQRVAQEPPESRIIQLKP